MSKTAQLTLCSLPSKLLGLVKKNILIVIGFIATIVFLALMVEILQGDVIAFDNAAYELIVVHMRRSWLTPIMQSISELALPVVLAVMLLAVEAFAPGKKPGACAV